MLKGGVFDAFKGTTTLLIWGDAGYRRECSPEERVLLERGDANDLAYYRSGDAALRDSWFARLEAQLAAVQRRARRPAPH